MSARKIFKKLPRPVRDMFRHAVGLVVDPQLLKDKKSVSSPLGHIARTWRYRMAALGVPLTANEKRFASYRNRYKGKRCFIMGNGPSLTKCDLTKLKDEYTFGVNSLFLIREEMGFDPTFYCVDDWLVADDRPEKVGSCRAGEAKFFGNYLKPILDPNEQSIWTNVRHRNLHPLDPEFSRNALRCLHNCGTVSYINMQLAYYMGFETVYLVGFDHSYKRPDDIKVEGEVWTSQSDDPNHFHPDYFGKGKRWHDPHVDRMENGYRVADREFKQDGRSIINATVGGQLEVFERVDYESLFDK